MKRFKTREEFRVEFGNEWIDRVDYKWNSDGEMDYLLGMPYDKTIWDFQQDPKLSHRGMWNISNDMITENPLPAAIPKEVLDNYHNAGLFHILHGHLYPDTSYARLISREELLQMPGVKAGEKGETSNAFEVPYVHSQYGPASFRVFTGDMETYLGKPIKTEDWEKIKSAVVNSSSSTEVQVFGYFWPSFFIKQNPVSPTHTCAVDPYEEKYILQKYKLSFSVDSAYTLMYDCNPLFKDTLKKSTPDINEIKVCVKIDTEIKIKT